MMNSQLISQTNPLKQVFTAVQTGILQRKCGSCSQRTIAGEKCEECEKKNGNLQRKSSSNSEQLRVPPIVSEVLNSPGRPLDSSTRAFFEPRFAREFSSVPVTSSAQQLSQSALTIGGPKSILEHEADRVADSVITKEGQNDGHESKLDLSHVRLHTDGKAAESASAVNALAYTVGNDIVFGAGQYAPQTREGSRLIAHELTHVVQQQPNRLHRKLKIDKPKDKIDNPSGKGLVQTNAETIEGYLQTLCSDGSVAVNKGTGAVSLGAGFCPKPMAVGDFGPPAPAGVDKSKEPTGCGCLCDMVTSGKDYTIVVDDKDWPHTSGQVVTAPSPNSPKLWGAATVTGKLMNIDPWLVLGHELCGHAWLSEKGLPDNNVTRGEGGHQETVERENELRQEHGIEERGSFKDPYCGESFWQDKAGPGPVQWSSYLKKCEAWRKKKYGGKYKISDKIP